MRHLLPAALIVLLLAPAARAGEAPVAPPPPATLEEISKQLTDLATRISDLVKVAKEDPVARKIDIYAKYMRKELQSTRGRIRAEELVEWMLDPKKNPKTVRMKAAEVLKAAKLRGDPDLSDTEKRGSKTRRADFAYRHLVKHLDEGDRMARKLANDVLQDWYPSARRQHPEIRQYSDAVDKTWRSAVTAWNKYLRKK